MSLSSTAHHQGCVRWPGSCIIDKMCLGVCRLSVSLPFGIRLTSWRLKCDTCCYCFRQIQPASVTHLFSTLCVRCMEECVRCDTSNAAESRERVFDTLCVHAFGEPQYPWQPPCQTPETAGFLLYYYGYIYTHSLYNTCIYNVFPSWCSPNELHIMTKRLYSL